MRTFVRREGSGIPPKGAFTPLISSFAGTPENVPNTAFPFVTMDFGGSLISREYTDASGILLNYSFDYIGIYVLLQIFLHRCFGLRNHPNRDKMIK
jgi:hypothetical protein